MLLDCAQLQLQLHLSVTLHPSPLPQQAIRKTFFASNRTFFSIQGFLRPVSMLCCHVVLPCMTHGRLLCCVVQVIISLATSESTQQQAHNR
jgi:hypothetical protein